MSEQTLHTPGPFEIVEIYPDCDIYIRAAGGPMIGCVLGPDNYPNPRAGEDSSNFQAEVEANAHLWKAGPDLLAFAEAVAAWNFNIQGDCVADAQAAARKVIARAKGETSDE